MTPARPTGFLAVTGVSHDGLLRNHNEDSLLVGPWTTCAVSTQSPQTLVFPLVDEPLVVAVADGLGGHPAGELASTVVVESLARVAGLLRDEDTIREAIQSCNQAVFDQASLDESRTAMGTTLAGVVISATGVHVFNVGDSRVYAVTASGVDRVSQDDSPPLAPGQTHTSIVTQTLGGSTVLSPVDPHVARHELDPRPATWSAPTVCPTSSTSHRRGPGREHWRGSGLPALEGRDGQGRPRQHHPRPRRVRLPLKTSTRAFPAFNRALPALIRAFRRRKTRLDGPVVRPVETITGSDRPNLGPADPTAADPVPGSVDLTERSVLIGELCRAECLDPGVVLTVERRHRVGQPARSATRGELNHSPRWNVWIGPVAGFDEASSASCGVGALAVPGETMNVSSLNHPMKRPLAPVLVRLHVALVPGHPERPVRHLGDEQVELAVRRAVPTPSRPSLRPGHAA